MPGSSRGWCSFVGGPGVLLHTHHVWSQVEPDQQVLWRNQTLPVGSGPHQVLALCRKRRWGPKLPRPTGDRPKEGKQELEEGTQDSLSLIHKKDRWM